MSLTTAKYVLPYPVAADAVSNEPVTLAALAARADLLLGESGSLTLSPAAATTLSTAVVLGRTYPGNSGAAVPGIVMLNLNSTLAAATGFQWWINGWTGTASTITGFTLNVQYSAAQTSRPHLWRFLPCL